MAGSLSLTFDTLGFSRVGTVPKLVCYWRLNTGLGSHVVAMLGIYILFLGMCRQHIAVLRSPLGM